MAAANVLIPSFSEVEESAEKRQAALDASQYSKNGILRYEFIFGRGFVSSGGGDTTEEILREIKLHPGGKAIDVGCGIGGGSVALADKFKAHVMGVDLSSNMIAIAKERYSSRPDVEFVVADALNIRVAPESCDLVYTRDTILHLTVEQKDRLFKAAFSWLKPGGQIVITDYCCGPEEHWDEEFKAYLKLRNYTLVPIKEYADRLKQAGFEISRASDHTERWLKSLDAESARLEEQRESFLHLFTPQDFDDLRHGWESKKRRVAHGRQFWGFFVGVKPQNLTALGDAAAGKS